MHVRKFTVFLFLAFCTFVNTTVQGFNDPMPDAVDKPATHQQNTSTHSNTMAAPKYTVLGMAIDFIKGLFFGNPKEPALSSDQGAPAQVQNQETITAPELQKPKRKATIVFDIDDTLCVQVAEGYHYRSDEKRQAALKQAQALFPECFIGIFTDQNTGDTYPHFFFPHYGELFVWILEKGWGIDFFSAGVKERNEAIIPQFLKHVLKPLVTDSEKFYQKALDAGQFRIFSRHHMVPGSEHPFWPEKFGQKKKNLNVASNDTANTVLVDDDPSYVLGYQYPFIKASYSASSRFPSYLLYPHESSFGLSQDLKDYVPYNAYYILGVLHECKTLMDQQNATSLKAALNLVIDKDYYNQAEPEHRKFDEWVIKGYEVAKAINPSLVFNDFRKYPKETPEKQDEDL